MCRSNVVIWISIKVIMTSKTIMNNKGDNEQQSNDEWLQGKYHGRQRQVMNNNDGQQKVKAIIQGNDVQ